MTLDHCFLCVSQLLSDLGFDLIQKKIKKLLL